MHPLPQNNVGLFLRHLALLCTKNFSVTACTSLKNQHCSGGGGGTNVPSSIKICKVSQNFWRVLYLQIESNSNNVLQFTIFAVWKDLLPKIFTSEVLATLLNRFPPPTRFILYYSSFRAVSQFFTYRPIPGRHYCQISSPVPSVVISSYLPISLPNRGYRRDALSITPLFLLFPDSS